MPGGFLSAPWEPPSLSAHTAPVAVGRWANRSAHSPTPREVASDAVVFGVGASHNRQAGSHGWTARFPLHRVSLGGSALINPYDGPVPDVSSMKAPPNCGKSCPR